MLRLARNVVRPGSQSPNSKPNWALYFPVPSHPKQVWHVAPTDPIFSGFFFPLPCSLFFILYPIRAFCLLPYFADPQMETVRFMKCWYHLNCLLESFNNGSPMDGKVHRVWGGGSVGNWWAVTGQRLTEQEPAPRPQNWSVCAIY